MTGKFFLMMLVGASVTSVASAVEPEALCEQAVALAEQQRGIPGRLLVSISHVESGRRDPLSGHFGAWPWTINAQGQGYFYNSKEEAITAARAFQAQGITSIDVGCMQINLHHHPDAFASLDEAFDPMNNARYGAQFLTSLFSQSHAWPAAVAAYHSLTPGLGEDYARHVLAVWNGTSAVTPYSLPVVQVPSGFGGGYASRPFAPNAVSYAAPARIIRHNFSSGNSGLPHVISGRDLNSYRSATVRLAWQR